MHVFTKRPKLISQLSPAKSALLNRSHRSKHKATASITEYIDTGNYAPDSSLSIDTGEAKNDLHTARASRLSHDLSQVPVHAKALIPVQPKLAISNSGEACEIEADRVAEKVMNMSDAQLNTSSSEQIHLREQSQARLNQGQALSAFNPMRKRITSEARNPSAISDALHSQGQPLETTAKAFFEPRFGFDFSQVRVHTDGRATESARAVNALAYTVGHNIVFGINQYAPGTAAGKALLAHELTHVVQQKGVHQNSVNIPCITEQASENYLQRKPQKNASSSRKKSKSEHSTLLEMVDDPRVAHEKWSGISSEGQTAVLKAMARKYGEDWADDFLAIHEEDLVNPRFHPLGLLAWSIEKLESDGFALAASLMTSTTTRFERWVHPDGSTAQMSREVGNDPDADESPTAPEALPPSNTTEEEAEEDIMDLSPEEARDLMGPVVLFGKIESTEILESREDGSRTIRIRTSKKIYTIEQAPNGTVSGMNIEDRQSTE